ncbi:MAG: hypothetical protein DDT27_01501 [Dehalococcoidia bacterium]|nr:hypothetical protein [Chloroflexota bacterium]
MFEPNIGNSVFPGFNDNQGIMLCGYEWGFSKNDQDYLQTNEQKRSDAPHVFSNKAAEYGEIANNWKYDNTIIYWFDLFGHKLSRRETGGNFEKCILQTNWCDTINNKIEGDYWSKLLDPSQVDNFIAHIEMFKPRLIFFFGSKIIKILQSDKVLPRFMGAMGAVTEPLYFRTKPFDGRIFNVGFQSFEKCKTVCFPHPSGSRGLSHDYIKLFSTEIDNLLLEFKEIKRVQ